MKRPTAYFRILMGVMVLVASLMCISAGAFANTTGTTADASSAAGAVPQNLTKDELNSLIAKMSDAEVRELVLERLATTEAASAPRAEPAAPPDNRIALDLVADTIFLAASRTFGIVLNSGATTSLILSILVNHATAEGAAGVATFVGLFAVVIALGAIANIGLERILKDWRMPEPTSGYQTFRQRLAYNAKRFLRDTVGLIAFFVVASMAAILLMPERDLHVARILIVWLIVLPRFVGAILRFILAPKHAPGLQDADDRTRQFLRRHLFGMAIVIGINAALVRLIGLTGEEVPGLGFWLNLIVFVWLGVVIVVARNGIRALIRGKSDTLTRREAWIANAYPWYAVALVILTWLFSMVAASAGLGAYLRDGSHLATLGVLMIVPLIGASVRSLVAQVMRPMMGEGVVAEEAQIAARNAYVRMARVLVIAGSLAIIGRLWGFGLVDLASSGVGDRFAERIIVFCDIILVGYFIWEIARLLINRKLAAEFTASLGLPADEDSTGIQINKGSSRLATVLPIFSWIVQSAIIAVTVLMALSNLGVDVTALVAGASIFGLAIGFGSQKLVSDIVSGMFFLVDDAFRIGEYVKLGDVEGTIEKFSLRSMMLRDSKGPLYCVPYSAIPKVTNFVRDWGIMKLKFNVAFGTDVEAVRKIFKKIGQQMMENPALKDGFIEPFKSQGVRDIKDGYIVIGGKFMHKPGAQFTIRKEIYRLVQRDFDAAGIKFYRSTVRVVSESGGASEETDAGAAAHMLHLKAAQASGA